MKATATIYLDKRRQKANGKYPLKLRTTIGEQSRYLPIGEDLSLAEYAAFKVVRDRKHLSLKQLSVKDRRRIENIRIKSDNILSKAEEIIAKLDYFNFEDFKNLMGRKRRVQQDVYALFEEEIERHEKREKIGTACVVKTSMRSFMKFRRKLDFHQITPDFLAEYEKWMLSEGKSITTVGIYLRDLRTVFNLAIAKSIVPKERYPFGRRKFVIPTSKGTKKALNSSELKKLFNYIPENDLEKWAKDIWFFSYFCQGMNISDIAFLTENDIEGNMIRFVRRKTSESSRSSISKIEIPIISEINTIIDSYEGESKPYLFPILIKGQTAPQQRNSIKQATRTVNKYISKIANKAGIHMHVTSYWARHTYATLLKRNNVSVEYISEALGHTSIHTTRSYLDSFEDDYKREMGNLTASFVRD